MQQTYTIDVHFHLITFQPVCTMCAAAVGGHADAARVFSRADAPSWGRALLSAGFANLCWQPSGYALYNRPITTK